MDSYIVYKITFEDGFAYVGYTQYTIKDRIRRHLNNPDNAELKRRLKESAYHTEILYEDIPTQDLAYRIERDEILKLQKPINISGVSPDAEIRHFGGELSDRHKQKRRYRKGNVLPPREGDFTCSICREKKPHTAFYKDRSRFNGLNSRCKICCKLRQHYDFRETTVIALANKQALENGLFVILSKQNGRTGLRDFHILGNESEQQ